MAAAAAVAAGVVAAAAQQAPPAVTGPPRGWNSYDAFSWTVNETQFLDNCAAAASLLRPSGFEYCVVDFLWFQCDWHYNAGGSSNAPCDVDNPSWLVDEYGRPQPDPKRWPSAANGGGFRSVSDQVHALGMKFGVHIMVGTSVFALDKTVKGTSYNVSEVIGNDDCPWPSHGHQSRCTCNWQAKSLDINVSHPGGRAFYDSLYEQYITEWKVDFVKNDCVFGIDFRPAQVKYQSSLIRSAGRHVVYSLSPGGVLDWAPPYDLVAQAKELGPYVDMYRMVNDEWDVWDDIAPSAFEAAHNASRSALVGAASMSATGRSWPDLDMIPQGFITTAAGDDGPTHWANLTLDEEMTQITLWSVAKSPLFFGGDLRKANRSSLSLLRNAEVLELDCCSHSNRQASATPSSRVWRASSADNSTIYVALFNVVGDGPRTVSATLTDVSIPPTWGSDTLLIRDVWSNATVKSLSLRVISAVVNRHGARLLAVTQQHTSTLTAKHNKARSAHSQ
jgi:hypothetical protein